MEMSILGGEDPVSELLGPDLYDDPDSHVEWALIGEQDLHGWAEYLLDEGGDSIAMEGLDPATEQVFNPEVDNADEYGPLNAIRFEMSDLEVAAWNPFVPTKIPFRSDSIRYSMNISASGELDSAEFGEFVERQNRQVNRKKIKDIEDRWAEYSESGFLKGKMAKLAKGYQRFQVIGLNDFHAGNKRKSLDKYGLEPETLQDVYYTVNEIDL